MAEDRLRALIVEAPYYTEISDELAAGAIDELNRLGADYERFEVPGALEIPGLIRIASEASGDAGNNTQYDAYVALGCVIRGETTHYDYVCGESARGLMELSLEHGLAVGNGILTVENRDQAWARADRKQKNKGRDAAAAALAMARARRHFGIAGG